MPVILAAKVRPLFLFWRYCCFCFDRIVRGGNGLCDGKVDLKNVKQIVDKAVKMGFRHVPEVNAGKRGFRTFFWMYLSPFVTRGRKWKLRTED